MASTNDHLDQPDQELTETPKAAEASSEIMTIAWDGPDDRQDPFNWSPRKKWATVALGLLVSFVSSMNGTIIAVAHRAISKDLHVSDGDDDNDVTSYWPTTSWGLGGALLPLVLFPVMEEYGVRPVVLGTHAAFTCSLIGAGQARDFVTLIVVRFFGGGCVQLLCNAVAGIIANVFDGDAARSVPIALYVTTYLSGTSLGPVIGAGIFRHLSWRWVCNVELIWTAALLPVLVILLPESRGSVILQARAKRRGVNVAAAARMPWYRTVKQSVQRPVKMLLTEPVVALAALWAAFILGTVYLFTQSAEQVYGHVYGWTPVQAGYVQAAVVVGQLFGCGLCVGTNHWYHASASRNREVPGLPVPEARLYASIIGGSVGVTGGMFVYGWTSRPHTPWIAPTLGLAMVGLGTTSVVVSIANYLIDAYCKYAGSALAAVGLVENTALALLPLAATALYTKLGFQWASSLLALVSLCLVLAAFAVLKWGKEIRARSPLMKEAVVERKMRTTRPTS